jgi:hypothetical protein
VIEPGTQSDRAALAGLGPISLKPGVEIPDQAGKPCLRGMVAVGEGGQFMHQPFAMHPAQRALADVELPGIIAQHDGIAEEFV